MYALGIDLGTTYTAAATWRDGYAEIASLGGKAAVIPSVVLRREDETFLTGDPANRRGLTEPHRLSREFKRRLGDTTPILLAGAPYSAEALTARLLRAVIEDVAEREGEKPGWICISHPANWGPYKKDLLGQAVRLAGVDVPVTQTTEPEAAAVFYSQQQRIDAGAVVAVYDLGGGTFDAAVLRKTTTGFEILGQPEGIERLGGIDFDAAVFAHVGRALGGALSELDEDDPAVVAAVARLRDECVAAKEALSSDTDTAIPVLLPALTTEVRLTREELEEMVRPPLHDTIAALGRALDSAGVEPEELHSVLLVGGASRMPIVAQLVGAELGRPVAVDAHPKHAVALGAAWLASGVTAAAAAAADAAAPAEPPAPAPVSTAVPVSPAPVSPGTPSPATASPVTASPVTASASVYPAGKARPAPVASGRTAPPPADRPAPPAPAPARRRLPLAAGAVALVLLAGGAAALAWSNQDTSAPAGRPAPDRSALPPDEQCTGDIQANPRWVCLTSASFAEDGSLLVEYEAEWAGEVPDQATGYHLHLYGGDGTNPPAETMGNQAQELGLPVGIWQIADQDPAVVPADRVGEVIGDAPKVCARIAGPPGHDLVPAAGGGYGTGNCVPITR